MATVQHVRMQSKVAVRVGYGTDDWGFQSPCMSRRSNVTRAGTCFNQANAPVA